MHVIVLRKHYGGILQNTHLLLIARCTRIDNNEGILSIVSRKHYGGILQNIYLLLIATVYANNE